MTNAKAIRTGLRVLHGPERGVRSNVEETLTIALWTCLKNLRILHLAQAVRNLGPLCGCVSVGLHAIRTLNPSWVSFRVPSPNVFRRLVLTKLVAHTGFEPVISALRGLRPRPLDECAVVN